VASATVRYVSLPARPGGTLVAKVRRDGGQVLRSRMLRGSFTIPAVAYDGSASGLSADAGTLVLIRPRARFPQQRTRLVVLDAKRLRLRSRLTLRGDFSFDALSPDGRTMYLIEYRSRRDPTRYAVRAYDLRRGQLLRAPIVDPREPDERMRGLPVSRATSSDGRWEYTLYDGAGSHPFVHALDTARGEAACIDLDALAGSRRLYQLRLRSSGRELSVVDGPSWRRSTGRRSGSARRRRRPRAQLRRSRPRAAASHGFLRRSVRRSCWDCWRRRPACRGDHRSRRRDARLPAGEAVASACHERRRVARLAAAAPTSLSPARGRGAAAGDRPR
jgi:hypothetical protein